MKWCCVGLLESAFSQISDILAIHMWTELCIVLNIEYQHIQIYSRYWIQHTVTTQNTHFQYNSVMTSCVSNLIVLFVKSHAYCEEVCDKNWSLPQNIHTWNHAIMINWGIISICWQTSTFHVAGLVRGRFQENISLKKTIILGKNMATLTRCEGTEWKNWTKSIELLWNIKITWIQFRNVPNITRSAAYWTVQFRWISRFFISAIEIKTFKWQ